MRISDWSSDVCSSDLHRRLLDDALAPQGAFVAVPALAIAGQPRRDRPDPPVERGRNFFARAVDIMARIVVIHEQGVVESAGDDQTRKGAQPGERSEERRVGNACVRSWRSRWSPTNKKKQRRKKKM